ncbi:hypothetical protein SAMN02745857_01823 [Andreprevotia lacus DSM 23236]|jgi:hypothetical protein|uniref:Chitinase n=1 Tax=Andreprevotia lacus DSM 23236 TaxID=1121001 RepID=A0A1W1XJX5_9NEIS|nr:chitinase [Andreprevotia lacus]SMC24293.1 hypothetical protein SAMN02745857_01823 [Andreprevotia lacus DSM 23236]
MNRTQVLALLAGVALTAMLAACVDDSSSVTSPTPVPTQPPTPTPLPPVTGIPQASVAYRFAPYLSSGGAFDAVAWSKATGQKYVTLAFYNSDGTCKGAWTGGDDAAVQAVVNDLRSLGGGVIIATGGWNGDDPARRCSNAAALAAVYQGVLDQLGADHLDIDPAAGDKYNNLAPAVVDLRNAALKLLQDNFKAQGKTLTVSYTLVSHADSGFDAASLYVLQSAKAAGVEIGLVNPMVMDFYDGVSGKQMGARGVLALQNVFQQLKALLPGKSDAQYWAMMGALPMIGQNDNASEVFTAADALTLLDFARQKGMGRLAFWSLGRDNGNCAGKTAADWQCSGLAQQQWEFSLRFGGF